MKSIIVQAQVVVSQNNTAYFHWQPLGIMLEKKKKCRIDARKCKKMDLETVMTM